MTINSLVIPHFPYNAIQCPVSVPLQLIREHNSHSASTLKIKFEKDRLTLDIPGDGTVTKEGWTITPFTHPTVSGVPTLCGHINNSEILPRQMLQLP